MVHIPFTINQQFVYFKDSLEGTWRHLRATSGTWRNILKGERRYPSFNEMCHTVCALYARFFQNLSGFKVNGGIPSMHLCMVPFERALHLEVFGQVLASPFEF